MPKRAKAKCPRCRAKYSLPLEAAGRRATCRSCGEVFAVPVPEDSLEEMVLAWLTEAEAAEAEDDLADRPPLTTPREPAGKRDKPVR